MESKKWREKDERRSESKQQRSSWTCVSALSTCASLCLLCAALCVVVFVRTSELQSRIQSLEQQQDSWISVEQLEPVLMGRLDRILEEVRWWWWRGGGVTGSRRLNLGPEP